MKEIHTDLVRQHYRSQLDLPDPFDRSAALDALAARGEAELLTESAARLLADPDPGVREHAARILVSLSNDLAAQMTVPLIASGNITARNLAGDVLSQMGPPAVRALVPMLDDADKDVRKFAVDVLAMLPAMDQVEHIARCLADEDGNVVLAAVDALGSLKAAEHAPALRALYDRDALARPNIVAAVGHFHREEDLPLLERALTDDNPVVQLTAAEALAGYDAPGVLPLLLRTVDEVRPMARAVVLSSIVVRFEDDPNHGFDIPERLHQYFVEMLDDLDPDYCKAAVRGLRFCLTNASVDALLAHAGTNDQVDVEIFKTLVPFPRAFQAVEASVAAGRMEPSVGANFVIGLLAQQAIGPADVEATGAFLHTHFGALEAETKIAAVNVCQHRRHPALHEVVLAGLEDPDPVVRSFATSAADTLSLQTEP